MSLVSEFKFLYERPFTPFSEWISDDPEHNLFWETFRVYSFKASSEQLTTKALLHIVPHRSRHGAAKYLITRAS